jgi:hypothetical protein
MTHSAAHGTFILICISFERPVERGHDDSLVVRSLKDALDGDVVVLDYVEDFRDPVPLP